VKHDTPNRLTVEDAKEAATLHLRERPDSYYGAALQQLADTMREVERLRGIIESCECGASEALADNPNKDIDNAN